MSEFTPHFAPIVVMAFLGAVFAITGSLIVFLYGALRRSRRFLILWRCDRRRLNLRLQTVAVWRFPQQQ